MRPAHLLAASIVAAWCAAAIRLGQPLWAEQTSRQLMQLGAIDGDAFRQGELWRLLTAQWLHARAPHMLFNVALIVAAGQGQRPVLPLYLAGGTIGILASVFAYPDLVSSGASQGALALAGAAFLRDFQKARASMTWIALLLGVSVQLALDLGSSAHMIKAGHAAGLLVGFSVALMTPREG